jgi:outer membrane protein assembly factor BamB
MPPKPCQTNLPWLLLATVLLYGSCAKSPGNPPRITTDTTATKPNVKLQPFTAQITFVQPNEAIVTWTASKDSLGDSIYYKVLLSGQVVASNLIQLTDSLKNIQPGSSYQGMVIAYNRFNDTTSAPFTLDLTIAYNYYYGFYDGLVHCVNVTTNQSVWTSNGGYDYSVFYGTPAIVGDTLFACYNDIDFVYAINATTGNTIWKSANMYASSAVNGPSIDDGGPIYSNGRLYILAQAQGVSCLNSTTGQILWTNGGTWYYTIPVVDNGKVFVGTLGNPDAFAFKAIDANTGATLWNQSLVGQTGGTPIVCNGLLIYTSGNGTCTALDENTGAQAWTVTLPGYSSNLTHYNNLVIGWFGTTLYALDASSGGVVWQMTAFEGQGDPFVSHDTVFVQDLVYGNPNNSVQLQALQATTGKVWWSATAPAIGAYTTIVAGGKIFTSSVDGQNTIVYSTKDGSVLGAASGPPGVIVAGGAAYYPAASGMVQ